MPHYLGETVTLMTGEIGVIEYMDEEMDMYEILLQDGNIVIRSSIDIL